jgi:predicted transcriptional regulator
MQDKYKVTLYLPPELHRQLKIRAAVDAEPMSTLAERALRFYLDHAEIVDEVEAGQANTHRVYVCPDCTSPVVLRSGELVSLRQSQTQAAVLVDDLSELDASLTMPASGEELVPC